MPTKFGQTFPEPRSAVPVPDQKLSDDLLDRVAVLGPALRQMAEDLALARRELAKLHRENDQLKLSLRQASTQETTSSPAWSNASAAAKAAISPVATAC